MKTIRALHLASFKGNIGDNANHLGFRSRLRSNIPEVSWDFTELEIRGLFRDEWRFDDDFAALVNTYDLLIIGGGNYFELWVEGSDTGTTIDLPPRMLRRILTPIWFNGLGVDPAQGASEENLRKFRAFLDHVIEEDQYLVSVRNDGSWAALAEYVGEEYQAGIFHVPDGGHFCDIEPLRPQQLHERPYIAVNVAGDMLDQRFGAGGYRRFVAAFAEVLYELLRDDPDRRVVFMPHIFRDLQPIHDLLEALPDAHRRERVSVNACVQGYDGAAQALDAYRNAALALGMRFHANVCPIGLNVPTVGLECYRQVGEYYRALDRSAWAVDVRREGMGQELLSVARWMLKEPVHFREQNEADLSALDQQLSGFHETVHDWLVSRELA